MESIERHTTVTKDGEVVLTGLPFKKGETVDVTLSRAEPDSARAMTVGALLDSGLIGMWRDRADIEDSSAFSRRLRETALDRPSDPDVATR